MRIISKMLLIVLLLLGLLLTLQHTAYAMAQITMVNRSQLTLSLYIDGNFGCGPVMPLGHFTNSPGLFCTSSITPGPHLLEARDGEKVMKHEDNVNIGDGTSPTWTVTIEDPDQELIKKLNGARFINESTEPPQGEPLAGYEVELYITGNTISERVRWTWVKPDVQLPPGRPIGVWSPVTQMQIVGREAHAQENRVGDRYDITFTINEDGNTITKVETCSKYNYTGTYVFTRQ
jgi:hypothetical protein